MKRERHRQDRPLPAPVAQRGEALPAHQIAAGPDLLHDARGRARHLLPIEGVKQLGVDGPGLFV